MILFLLLLGMAIPASAQMTDLMGNLAIQGMMTTQSVKEYNAANIQIKKNTIAQELQIKNMKIQTLMINNPKNVSRETFFIAGYSASAQIESGRSFSITLKGVEKNILDGINANFAGAKKIEKNKNNIKFYY